LEQFQAAGFGNACRSMFPKWNETARIQVMIACATIGFILVLQRKGANFTLFFVISKMAAK
jgi:hypothetical protein